MFYSRIFILFTLQINIITSAILHTSSNQTHTIDNIAGVEVPDEYLLLFDGLNVDANVTGRGRAQKQKPAGSAGAAGSAGTVGSTGTAGAEGGEAGSSRRCSCSMGVCKCCTGYIMDLINQKACMKVTYHPGDFAFDVAMSLNNRVLYENSLSGKNPRPICISPPRISNLKVCAKFYNVFFPGRNFHFCLAMTGQWRQLELFNFAFDCLRMGANGIAMVGPDEGGGIQVPNPHGGVDAVVDSGPDDIDDYDENVVRSLLGDLLDDDDDDEDDDR